LTNTQTQDVRQLTNETPQLMSRLAASSAALFGLVLLKSPMMAMPIDWLLYPRT